MGGEYLPSEFRRVCKVCGERISGNSKKTCGKEECKKVLRRRYNMEYYEKYYKAVFPKR